MIVALSNPREPESEEKPQKSFNAYSHTLRPCDTIDDSSIAALIKYYADFFAS